MKQIQEGRFADTEESLTDRCAAVILEQIQDGKLRPAQRLGEVAIARRLKMGRAPVRAAFDRLAFVGLLERIPRSGTFVRKVTLEEYCELMDVRGALESMAARLACTRLTAEELEHFAAVARRLDQLGDEVDARPTPISARSRDYRELQKLEQEFHGGIAEASGNRRIVQILSQQNLVELGFKLGMKLPGSSLNLTMSIPTHVSIVDALKTRDPDMAGKTVLANYLATKQAAVARASGHAPAPATGRRKPVETAS